MPFRLHLPRPLTAPFALATACLLALAATPVHAIVITATGDADLLATTILGTGIEIKSAGLDGGLLDSADSSAALFSGGLASGVGIDSGILLTTGMARLVGNTNTSSSTGADFGGSGKAYLDALSGENTYDATVLDIKFKTNNGNLYFNFAFASDEYNEFVNSQFNDVFGFFVDDVNIALIPNTTTPIAINTVNAGPSGDGIDATNPQYFRNNAGTYDEFGQLVSSPFALEYDGITRVFTVFATGLDTATSHTIRLAIADSGDHIYDSGVFIQANSFGSIVTPKDIDPFEDHPHPDDSNSVPDSSPSLLLCAGGLALIGVGRRIGSPTTSAKS